MENKSNLEQKVLLIIFLLSLQFFLLSPRLYFVVVFESPLMWCFLCPFQAQQYPLPFLLGISLHILGTDLFILSTIIHKTSSTLQSKVDIEENKHRFC